MTVPRASCLLLLSASFTLALALAGCEKVNTLIGNTPAPSAADTLSNTKLEKYAKAQEDLAKLHPFDKEMAQYIEYNPDLKGSDPLSSYAARTDPFTSAIFLLKDAMQVKADLGPVDASATRLLATLETLNPTVKAMQDYVNTHGIETDGGAKARELDPIYRAQMKDASAAARDFSRVLTDKAMALDTARLSRVTPNSPEFFVLQTNLDSRRSLEALDVFTATPSPAARAAFSNSLAPLAKSNQDLAANLAAYKGDATIEHCKLFATLTAKEVADGKAAALAPHGKALYGSNAEAFVSDSNDTLSDFNYCIRDLHPSYQLH